MNRTWVVAIAGVGAAGVAALVIAVLRCEAQGAAAVAPAASTTSAAPTDPAGLSAPATASLPIASSGVGAAVAAAADAPRVAHPPARTVAAGDAVTTTAKTAIELPAAPCALRIREMAARLPDHTDVARRGRTYSGEPEMVRQHT
ncbi:MAG: hypothetical protein HZA54_12730, partial [Planctomycetes bacterium]|nr:hypothetical protein [Planctomycetota bacterium]